LINALASLWGRATVDVPRHNGQSHVLVIDDWFPDPRIGAGAPRALELQRAIIAAGAELTLLPTLKDPDEADVHRLLPGGSVATGYGRKGIKRLLSRRRGRFDLIIVSRPHNMIAFRQAVTARPHHVGATPVVYDSEALFATREALRSEIMGRPLSAAETARQVRDEIALADGSRVVLVVNDQSAAPFRAAGHADVRVLGHAVAPRPTSRSFEDRKGFLFVGPTYTDDTPNSDAVVWFIDRVLPDIRRALGRDVPFVLAGVATSPMVTARAKGDVQALGPLPDLTDAYSRARVFVAPTRFACGIPIKVYDAAAQGVPTVLTPLLAEQIGWRHEHEVLVAATPQQFAEQCLRLHGDRDLWERIRACALARVTQDCDPPRFKQMVTELLAQARPAKDAT
jgi:glycosyltransferase involved in cell wall biosynthesis